MKHIPDIFLTAFGVENIYASLILQIIRCSTTDFTFVATFFPILFVLFAHSLNICRYIYVCVYVCMHIKILLNKIYQVCICYEWRGLCIYSHQKLWFNYNLSFPFISVFILCIQRNGQCIWFWNIFRPSNYISCLHEANYIIEDLSFISKNCAVTIWN